MSGIVGVDIGTTAVRAVRLSGLDADGYAVISSFAVVPLRLDAVHGGAIRNQAAVATAVQDACEKVGSRKNVVLGAIAPEAAVGRLWLPSAVKASERLAAITTQGIQVAPAIMPQDAVLSVSEVGLETSADGRSTVALNVAATTSEEVEALSQVAARAKVRLRAIDLLGAGTLRALVRDVPGSRDVTCIVDIGASTTRVVTREGLVVRSIRTFPNGGNDLTRALAAVAKESFEEAERRKQLMRLPATVERDTAQRTSYAGLDDDDEYVRQMNQQNAVDRALAAATELLIEQIANAVELDATRSDVSARVVTLCGGSALLRGLKERLSRRLGVEVRLGHPWARLEHSKEHVEHFLGGAEDPKLMLSLVNAVGLALWSES
jgi:type IV pilus assembly protein PilM